MRKHKKNWVARIILFKLALFALLTYAVMLLWNNIVVDLFGLKSLSYFQALGLLILVRILTGNIGPKGFNNRSNYLSGKGMLQQHWKSMSADERKQWTERMGRRDWSIDKEHAGE